MIKSYLSYFFSTCDELAPLVREMEIFMERNEIIGYEPLLNDLKQLIQEKQYKTLQMINSETINLYWEIVEEIYRQQQVNGWGKSIVEVLSNGLQKEFPGSKGYSAANLWRMRIFIYLIVTLKKSHHWCEKLVGAIIL